MARPKKSLVDHILEGSFRPDRAYLLKDPLPRQIKGVAPAMLEDARLLQTLWLDADDAGERHEIALEFADLIRRIHDARGREDCCVIHDRVGPTPSVVARARAEGDSEHIEAFEEWEAWDAGGRDGPAPRSRPVCEWASFTSWNGATSI
jgi:hypothetical protein